jgi:hypothetical protein
MNNNQIIIERALKRKTIINGLNVKNNTNNNTMANINLFSSIDIKIFNKDRQTKKVEN